ncbi:MAG: hypothetical protein LBL69_02095, partial [Zoogloeaceae bacterium]|nr:hypothetical protein [Zoogloeaceae bacterium]
MKLSKTLSASWLRYLIFTLSFLLFYVLIAIRYLNWSLAKIFAGFAGDFGFFLALPLLAFLLTDLVLTPFKKIRPFWRMMEWGCLLIVFLLVYGEAVAFSRIGEFFSKDLALYVLANWKSLQPMLFGAMGLDWSGWLTLAGCLTLAVIGTKHAHDGTVE